jgi:hypothetical protein
VAAGRQEISESLKRAIQNRFLPIAAQKKATAITPNHELHQRAREWMGLPGGSRPGGVFLFRKR